MKLYRVTVECEILVEGVSIEDAEDKVLTNPGMYDHDKTILLEQTVECDEDGEELELEITCPNCHGAGIYDDCTCTYCDGTKTVLQENV